jgi:branched-chain amino acid transport system permease protein
MNQLLMGILLGCSYGMVLFIIAMGLSVLFGFMGIIQLAHGAIFLMAGFTGITVANLTSNFLLGIFAGVIAGGVIGLTMERGFLRLLYKQQLAQVLITFGFISIITNITRWIFGSTPVRCPPFSFLQGSLAIGQLGFPIYRLAIIIFGLLLFLVFFLLERKSRVGAVIRAGMEDAEMVSGLGINLQPYSIAAFCTASCLAGLGAVIAGPMLGGLRIEDAQQMTYVSLAVIIVGGVGSVLGTLAGAIIIGITTTLVGIYVPALPMFAVYILMILVLLIKPAGLLGKRNENRV